MKRLYQFLSNLLVFRYLSYQLGRLKATKNFFLTYNESQLEHEEKPFPHFLEETPRETAKDFDDAVSIYDSYATKFHRDQVVKFMKPSLLKKTGYTKAQMKVFDREAFETILDIYCYEIGK